MSLAQRMAIENPHITAVAVEATEFPDLVRRYRINGVPKTVVDDRVEILGSLPEPDFVRSVLAERLPKDA
ncbi:MAG: glutaredoxin-like domain protein [Acidobacteria bacterium]|nr:glutaredoxin-like domain protein [Acidobacteriota bacterium]